MHEIYEHKVLMVKRLEFIQTQFEIDLNFIISEYKKRKNGIGIKK